MFAAEVRRDLEAWMETAPLEYKLAGAPERVNCYGLSLERLDQIFAHLSDALGQAHAPLLPEELAEALRIAKAPGSAARCALAGAWDGRKVALTKEDERAARSKLLRRAEAEAMEYFDLVYSLEMLEAHEGVPQPIQVSHAERYKAETGRDVLADFEVDRLTGLSRNACCFEKCPWNLARTDKPNFIQQHIRDSVGFVVPGLHGAIMSHPNANLPTILRAIEEGLCLKEPLLYRQDERELASVEEARREEYRRALVAQKKEAQRRGIQAFLKKMAPEFLECTVFSILSKRQTYEEFKEAFDRAYA